jgi:hypothetical protein
LFFIITNVVFFPSLLGLKTKILAISESQMGEKAELDNIAPIQTGERVQALHANVATTGEYLQARFQELGNYLQNDVFSAISDELHSHHGAISSDLYDQHEMMVGQLEDHHETIGEALEEHNDAIGTMLQNHQQDIGGMLEKHHDLLIAHWNENFELRKQVNRIEGTYTLPFVTWIHVAIQSEAQTLLSSLDRWKGCSRTDPRPDGPAILLSNHATFSFCSTI